MTLPFGSSGWSQAGGTYFSLSSFFYDASWLLPVLFVIFFLEYSSLLAANLFIIWCKRGLRIGFFY